MSEANETNQSNPELDKPMAKLTDKRTCPECGDYITWRNKEVDKLRTDLAAAEKERDLWRKLHKDELVQNKRYKDALETIRRKIYAPQKIKEIAKQALNPKEK